MRWITSATLMLLAIALPVQAHQTQNTKDANVTATIHLQPNDRPIAGTPTPTWFQLQRRDGSIIPLSQCLCRVEVHNANHQITSRPELQAVTINNGEAAMATRITFPRATPYTVYFIGSPKSELSEFPPFRIAFPVQVSAPGGSTSRTPERPQQQRPAQPANRY